MKAVEGGIYKHYKGGIYYLIAIAKHTESKESLVIYRGSTGMWARPMEEFMEYVRYKGEVVPRFEFIG